MKIAINGDLHSQIWQLFNKILPDGKSSRLQACIDVLKFMLDYCNEDGIETFVDLGDSVHVTHGMISVQALCATQTVRAQYRNISQILIKGNHEGNLRSPEHGLNAFKHIPNCAVIDSIQNVTWKDNIEFISIPYGIEEAREYLANLGHKIGKRYIFTHHGIAGAELGTDLVLQLDDTLSMELLDKVEYDYLFAGHYHKFQVLNDRTIIVGSPLQHTRREVDNDNVFLILNTDTNEIDVVRPPSKKFYKIEVNTIKDLNDLPDNGYIEFDITRQTPALIKAVYDIKNEKYQSDAFITMPQEEIVDKAAIDVNLEKETILSEYIKMKKAEIEEAGMNADQLLQIGIGLLIE